MICLGFFRFQYNCSQFSDKKDIPIMSYKKKIKRKKKWSFFSQTSVDYMVFFNNIFLQIYFLTLQNYCRIF
ncbi:hypothetical protein HanIR_Chr04g0178051 [Helianthus annuus]|nr:hypothetical protein HanIR_Chr04g0178051 [Helianthus annuus]